MTQVCEDWFPMGTYKHQKKAGFYMEDILKQQIDILLKNIVKDWDFTIIITGGGEVRVGKSVLAMHIAAYWAYQMWKVHKKKVPFDLDANFVFDGKKLIQKGNELGQHYPYSPLIFDEAGAELEGKKIMQGSTQEVLDYFRECGQYNLLNILVMPEYFDLPKGIALSRAIFLIDVYYTADETGLFQRGFYNFYSRRNKKYLYLKGKRELNYSAHKYNFHGQYFNFYPVDEKKYRKLKQDALIHRQSKSRSKFQLQRDASWYLLSHEGLQCKCGEVLKLNQTNLAQRMEQMTGIYVHRTTLGDGIKHFVLENE